MRLAARLSSLLQHALLCSACKTRDVPFASGNSPSGKSESINNGTYLKKNCVAAIDETDLKSQVAINGQQLSSLHRALASFLQASIGKADSLLTATQGGQDTININKFCSYANVVTADVPSVVKTVVFHTVGRQAFARRYKVSKM